MHTTIALAVARAFFPLDQRLGLGDTCISPELARLMVWVSGLLPYTQAQQIMERIGHHPVSRNSIWQETQVHGARLLAYVERQEQRVGVEQLMVAPPGCNHPERQGVSMDGGMVHIRGEGWKEMKVGTVYDIEARKERDPETHELVERAHGVKIEYTAVLGTAEEFSPALWKLAWQRGLPMATDSSVTADGAEWIWNLAQTLFPYSVQIVDWYHACEHLAEAAQARSPGDREGAQRWFHQRCAELYKGEIHKIIRAMEQANLGQYVHYFQSHARRMQYQQFVEEGYPIGSGTVESGIKQYKTRLTGAGMQWKRPSAEQMLIIRGAVLSDNFNALWLAA